MTSSRWARDIWTSTRRLTHSKRQGRACRRVAPARLRWLLTTILPPEHLPQRATTCLCVDRVALMRAPQFGAARSAEIPPFGAALRCGEAPLSGVAMRYGGALRSGAALRCGGALQCGAPASFSMEVVRSR